MILASLENNHLKWNSNGVHCILKYSNVDKKALSDKISFRVQVANIGTRVKMVYGQYGLLCDL
jgi:hypothetical protein